VEKKSDIDKNALTDAGLLLQKAFNKGDKDSVTRAIKILTDSISTNTEGIAPTRVDRIDLNCNHNFISSGLDWLDEAIGGGLRREELLIIGAVPHGGKTHLLSFFAGHYAKSGLRILHLNGEDLVTDIAGIYRSFLSRKEMQNVFLADVVDHRFNADVVNSTIERMIAEKLPPDLIVADNLDIMSIPPGYQDWLGVGELARELRFIGKKHNAIMLTASQMNFSDQGGGGMARFYRGKVSKTSHADLILTVDDVYENEYTVSVAKARGRRILKRQLHLQVDFDKMEIVSRDYERRKKMIKFKREKKLKQRF